MALPELHLLLRVTNKMLHELERRDRGVFDAWMAQLGITRPKLHSGEFNGNMCRKILCNTDSLRCIIDGEELEESISYLSRFVEALDAFNDIRISCFGAYLTDDIECKIHRFRECYLRLNVSVSTSVHIVFNHLIQFVKFYKSSLGAFSEQAAESVHSDFLLLWQSCKIDIRNENYPKYLHDAVVRYDGRHLCP